MRYDATSEVRFAVVLYGGVSLAIYMNGIAQELLELVRATSPSTDDPSTLAVADAELSGSGRVYREFARRLDQGGPVVANPGDPVRTRFVVDIITGTSAGGINGVVLAKALANDQSIATLSDLWVSEGDIDRLVNDRQALKGLDLKNGESPPLSLLSGDRMLYLLLRAIDGVSESNQAPARSPHADEIDLWITTTDLEGRPDKVDLSQDGVQTVTEPNHRMTFHFVYDHRPESPEPLNLFSAEYDPMLAFAARCTSSFPGAFKPVQLTDLEPVMDGVRREVARRGRTPTEWPALADDEFANFFSQYGRDHPQAWKTVSFADGGYLNNRPVDLVMETLPKRRAALPVARRVLIVEPDPGEPLAELVDKTRSRVGLVSTLLKVISLPRTQTIGQVVDRILALREPLRSRERIYAAVEGAISTDQGASANTPAAAGYRAYRLARTADDLGRGIARVGYPDRRYDVETEQRRVATRLVERWFTQPSSTRSAGEADSRADMVLGSLDLAYELRRINFLQGRAGRLMRTESQRFAELRDARRRLDAIYTELAQAGRSLRYRREDAPELAALRAMMGDVPIAATDDQLGEWLSEDERDAVLGDALTHFASQLNLSTVGTRIDEALEGLPDIQGLASKFDRYDEATYALNTLIPGENDDIEVIRVSPRDTSNIRADSTSNPKLAGSAVHHFGAFFSADWRRNDIFWGRLDGAERIITSLYPATSETEVEDRRSLITDAQTAIIREALQDDDYRQMLGRCFAGGEPPAKPEAESPTAVAEAGMVFQALKTAPPPEGPTPEDTLATAARAARVTDRVGEGLGLAEGPGATASLWMSRVLRFGAGLAELALPNRATSIVGRHLLDLAVFAALIMILLGGVIGGPSVSGFGWTVLFIAVAAKIVLELTRRWLRQPVPLVATLAGITLVVGFAVYAAAETDGWRRVLVLLLTGFAIGLFIATFVLRTRSANGSDAREPVEDGGSPGGEPARSLGTTGVLVTVLAILAIAVSAVLGVEGLRDDVSESLCTDHPDSWITEFTTNVLATSCQVQDVGRSSS